MCDGEGGRGGERRGKEDEELRRGARGAGRGVQGAGYGVRGAAGYSVKTNGEGGGRRKGLTYHGTTD